MKTTVTSGNRDGWYTWLLDAQSVLPGVWIEYPLIFMLFWKDNRNLVISSTCTYESVVKLHITENYTTYRHRAFLDTTPSQLWVSTPSTEISSSLACR
jgi:hypothetical protein